MSRSFSLSASIHCNYRTFLSLAVPFHIAHPLTHSVWTELILTADPTGDIMFCWMDLQAVHWLVSLVYRASEAWWHDFRDIIWYNTSSDVTQWVSCMVGNVGTRFGRGILQIFCKLHPQVFLVFYFSTSCLCLLSRFFSNIPSLVRPCFLSSPRVLCICFLCPLVCTNFFFFCSWIIPFLLPVFWFLHPSVISQSSSFVFLPAGCGVLSLGPVTPSVL